MRQWHWETTETGENGPGRSDGLSPDPLVFPPLLFGISPSCTFLAPLYHYRHGSSAKTAATIQTAL